MANALALVGATPRRKKELIGFQVGVRESAQSCRELLDEAKSRGLKIAPSESALGFWNALDEVFLAALRDDALDALGRVT